MECLLHVSLILAWYHVAIFLGLQDQSANMGTVTLGGVKELGTLLSPVSSSTVRVLTAPLLSDGEDLVIMLIVAA